MHVKKTVSKNLSVFEINKHSSITDIRVGRSQRNSKVAVNRDVADIFYDRPEGLQIKQQDNETIIKKNLGALEHILGLGEKAFDLDRRRISVSMWNRDCYEYGLLTDPMYVSIPFFISVEDGWAKGYFVDSTSKINFDIGTTEYDKILISIPESTARLFIIEGPIIETVIENYVLLTGHPFKLPSWALGHQISRYSYYPQNQVMEVAKLYKISGIPVSCIYLDIDYMRDRRIFTWDEEKFPDPRKLVNRLHSAGIKVVAIVDPGIMLDQSYEVFKSGLGTFCETSKGEVYTAPVWPGKCVFPDFFSSEARSFWSKWIEKFVSESGIDGIWLDMNEPAAFTESRTFDDSVVHKTGDGKSVKHGLVHNAYAYFESLATFDSLSKISKEPFVLTRAGCHGIQRYAAVWSGDNTSSWENMRLQIPLLLGLSLSGVPYVGCDIGGFIGKSDPELLTRYYQMATFFPIFRNHKSKEGNDQEAFRLPAKNFEKIKQAIFLRYSLLPYLESLAYEAHEFGHPIIRPLAYEFQEDENTYSVNDEYMVGKSLLFAPIVEKGRDHRELYLPEGKWTPWEKRGEVLDGGQWMRSTQEMPLFLRKNSMVPTDKALVVWGIASFRGYDGEREFKLISKDQSLASSQPYKATNMIEFVQQSRRRATVDGKMIRAEAIEGSTLVRATRFRNVSLLD